MADETQAGAGLIGWGVLSSANIGAKAAIPAIRASQDGRLVEKTLRQQRMTRTDLAVAARQQGFRRFDDIALAVLEPDGKVSFFNREDEPEEGAPETTIDS